MRRITLMTFCLICTFVAGCVDGSTPAPTAMPPTSPPASAAPTTAPSAAPTAATAPTVPDQPSATAQPDPGGASPAGGALFPTPLTPNVIVLAEAQGDVQLQRQGGSFAPTVAGAPLQRGDSLRLGDSARGQVICDGPDARPVSLTPGLNQSVNEICPPPPEPLQQSNGATVLPSRPGGGKPPLYIISPRRTYVFADRPLDLRWTATEATSYTVRIRGTDWVSGTSEAQLRYDGPALEPGRTYLLVVEDSTGKVSLQEQVTDIGFRVLRDDEAQRIRAYADQATAALASGNAAYVRALRYADFGLIADAITLLEELARTNDQQPWVQLTLGELYARSELEPLAEPSFRRALALAEHLGDPLLLARSQYGLGKILLTGEHMAEGRNLLEHAQPVLAALGDTARAEDAAMLLDALPPPDQP